APLWLLAIAATALPILYHLRRNTPPEVIRVGSVADLTHGAATANRRVPRNLLLLAVRCALLGVVALALAEPIMAGARAGRRVVVAPRGAWDAVDSLTAGGAVRHVGPETDYPWSAAIAATHRLSAHDTLLLIAPDDASRWLGPRPSIGVHATAIPVKGGDPAQPGPPASQRAPALTADDAPMPHAGVATLLWWMAIALLPLERMLATRVPDAG